MLLQLISAIFADTSFNFTGNSPAVIDDVVIFQLSFGRGVVGARCAVMEGNKVLQETNCECMISGGTEVL